MRSAVDERWFGSARRTGEGAVDYSTPRHEPSEKSERVRQPPALGTVAGAELPMERARVVLHGVGRERVVLLGPPQLSLSCSDERRGLIPLHGPPNRTPQ